MTKRTNSVLFLKDRYWKILSAFLIVMLSGSAVLAQDYKSAEEAFKKQNHSGALSFGVDTRFLKIDDSYSLIPAPRVSVDLWRINMGINLASFKIKRNLLYQLNDGPVQTTDYNYKISNISLKLKYLLSTLRARKNYVNLWIGFDWSRFTVRDVDTDLLRPLYGSNDFIQIKRLRGMSFYNGLITLEKPFWVRNTEFSLTLSGYYPVFTEDVMPTDKKSSVEIGLAINIGSKFKVNPLKVKNL